MAGGKGSRMHAAEEKPLVKVGGTELLTRVLAALRASKHVGRVVVASSPRTPATTQLALRLGAGVIVTPGDGYVEDMRYALRKSGSKRAIVVNADLPFLTGGLIDDAVERFLAAKKPSLAVMLPSELMAKGGSEPPEGSRGLWPSGLNVLDAGVLEVDAERLVEEEVLVSTDSIHLLNVNTRGDLERAERLMTELPQATAAGGRA